MSQQVQELIDKIKSEGVEAARQETERIVQEARNKAQHILAEAKQKAERMTAEASQDIKKLKESTEMSLKQSSRDTVLSLRARLEEILKKIVYQEVADALKPDQLAEILERVMEKALHQKAEVASIEVALNAKDLEQLKKSFIAKLQKKIKEPINFKASDDIASGFTISFDGGKSSFDFTDESLAKYLGQFLNAQVAALVKEAHA